MRKRRLLLFKDDDHKKVILKNIYNDYIIKNMTINEIADNYGYNSRQIRYIINYYLNIKKGSGCKRKMEIEKLDDDSYVIEGKIYRKCTLEELIEKAEMARIKINKQKKSSTNKTVENNKEIN